MELNYAITPETYRVEVAIDEEQLIQSEQQKDKSRETLTLYTRPTWLYQTHPGSGVCAYVCVRVCVCACVRACVCVLRQTVRTS